jgi:hypothetical protein
MVATDLKMTAAGDSFDTVADTSGHVLIPTEGSRPRPVHGNGLTCGRRCVCVTAGRLIANFSD